MVNKILAILAISGFLFAGTAFSETPKPKTIKDMTTDEIIASIKNSLENEDEILNFIPNIKLKTDAEGRRSYLYLEGAKELKLEELGREKLEKLLISINQAATQIRAENINRQLESIRQAQNMQRMNAMQNLPRSVVNVPVPPPRPPMVPPQYRVPQPPPAPSKK